MTRDNELIPAHWRLPTAVYNSRNPRMLRSLITPALGLLPAAPPHAICPTPPTGATPETQLAEKIAAITGPGVIALEVTNSSSLSSSDAEQIRRGLDRVAGGFRRADLRARPVRRHGACHALAESAKLRLGRRNPASGQRHQRRHRFHAAPARLRHQSTQRSPAHRCTRRSLSRSPTRSSTPLFSKAIRGACWCSAKTPSPFMNSKTATGCKDNRSPSTTTTLSRATFAEESFFAKIICSTPTSPA